MSELNLGQKVFAGVTGLLLASTFSSSPLLAASVNLGTVMLSGDADSRTCFDGGAPCSSEDDAPTANSSTATAYSSAQTTANLSQITSISAHAEADPLPGGATVNPNFAAIGSASVSLDYHFEIQGPLNTTVPVLIMATMNDSVSGTLTGFDGYSSSADLLIDGGGQTLANTELFLQSSSTIKSGSFSIDQTDMLETNTAYEVFMRVGAGASIDGITNVTGLSASASIDPSFQIGAGYSDYSIVFAPGIGDTVTATPLPAAFPMFAGGLGMVGFLARRKKNRSALSIA